MFRPIIIKDWWIGSSIISSSVASRFKGFSSSQSDRRNSKVSFNLISDLIFFEYYSELLFEFFSIYVCFFTVRDSVFSISLCEFWFYSPCLLSSWMFLFNLKLLCPRSCLKWSPESSIAFIVSPWSATSEISFWSSEYSVS